MDNQLIAVADQAWAMAASFFKDIERLADTGVGVDGDDVDLIRAVMHLVASEVIRRKDESEDVTA